MIEIKSWEDGRVLYTAKNAEDVRAAVSEAVKAKANLRSANLRSADLRSADLGSANLRSADLRSANLRSADLRSADLGSADLRSADLRSANLRSADLRSADLRSANLRSADLGSADLGSARGLNPYLTNDLLMMKDQIGKIRAYKVVTSDGHGPTFPSIKYEVKREYEVEDANCADEVECGAGINLATLSWCMREWRPGNRILLAEFKASDIAALPNGDGKFRVFRCRIVKELDLEQIGLVVPVEAAV